MGSSSAQCVSFIIRTKPGRTGRAHSVAVIPHAVLGTIDRPSETPWLRVWISFVGLCQGRIEGDKNALEAVPNQRGIYPPRASHELDGFSLVHRRPCPNLQVIFGVAHDGISPIVLPCFGDKTLRVIQVLSH